jgi:hypothetical protein
MEKVGSKLHRASRKIRRRRSDTMSNWSQMARAQSHRRPTVVLAIVIAVLMAAPVASLVPSGAPSSVRGTISLTSPSAVGTSAAGAAQGPAAGPPNPCDGPYPAFAGLPPFPAGCVGRDQAIAGFYSNLAGGAGNVSLQLTLPVDRSPTANQSDLYRAIWVGLVLADPSAWMSQCFLEIRFQPDSSWTTTVPATAPDNWTGVVIGYETNSSTSREQACFEQPLTSSGSGGGIPLTFTGGDQLNISTLGWAGSAAGEQVSVVDATTGASSQVRGIVDNGVPLDPAYSASDVLDALASAAAQVAPVSVGVELAGGANPSIPSNSSFGGCTPGVPPPTAVDGPVPCPSYDPTSWVNDTAAPMLLTPPVFSAGASNAPASELLLASTTGGTAGLTQLSNSTCTGRLGSAFCTYPWFSYSCGAGALEFGATDYSGVTTDFGKEAQYSTSPVPGLLGYPQFPSEGYSVPACGAGTNGVTVGVSSGAGVVRFLAANLTSPTSTQVPTGDYAISAIPAPGEYFAGWTSTGSATVTAPNDASTTLVTNTGGSVEATFSSSASLAVVDFATSGGNGSLEVGVGAPGTLLGLPVTVPNGGSIDLAPGIYPIQDAAGFGFSSTGWNVSGGVAVASPGSPATWLVVPVGTTTADLTGRVLAAGGNVTVFARTVGNGTVLLNGTPLTIHPVNATTYGSVVGAPGTYTATAIPDPGWTFLGWTDAPGAVALPMGNSTNATVASGTAYLYGQFAANVTVLTSPSTLGGVSFNDTAPVGNGTVVPLVRGGYTITAAPVGGAEFQHWSVSSPKALYVVRADFPFSKLIVNGTGTLTAVFANASTEGITFDISPAGDGSVQFNFQNLTATSTLNSSVVNTTYELRGFPNAGYKFLGFNTTGPAIASAGELAVTGPGAVVTAKFGLKFYPVTVIATRPGSVDLSLDGSPVASGTTLSLATGVYDLSETVLGSNTSFLGWSSGLTVANVTAHGTATVKVSGAGTVIGIVALFVLNGLGVSPGTVDVNSPVHFSIFANGSGALQYRYFGLPAGCSTANRQQLTCDPTSAGTYPVHATVTDSGGAVGTTAAEVLTVVGSPLVSAFTATPSATDVGIPVQLLVTPELGLGPYTFAYANLPAGCVSADQANLTCTPTASGTGVHVVRVTVTDSLGHSAEANATVTVNAAPSVVSAVASLKTTDVNIATWLNVTTAGGTGVLAYVYSNLPTGCLTADTPALRCDPNATGTSNVSVLVTDTFGLSARGNVPIQVNARPSAAELTIAPSTIAIGQSTLLTAGATGGTGGYTFVYLGLPSGCTTSNASTLTCTPLIANNYQITVTVTDALGASTSTSAILAVSAAPSPNTSPGGGGVSGIDWLVVALFAIVALVISILLIAKYGKPPAPTPVPTPPAGTNPRGPTS